MTLSEPLWWWGWGVEMVGVYALTAHSSQEQLGTEIESEEEEC